MMNDNFLEEWGAKRGRPLRVIISGGGTAGHIYPAVSVADVLREMLVQEGVEILFVGAEGKMEMERVPRAGYEIVGLPVAGLQRQRLISWANLMLPLKVMRSLFSARQIVREFRPDVVVGFGGYASAPVLWMAQRMGIPTVIQEQNSYAGLTNRVLSKRAKAICVAYDGMEAFFPAEKIVHTGNPLRGSFSDSTDDVRTQGYDYFGLNPDKKTILVVGGSLGTRTLNRCMLRWMDVIAERSVDIQVIWQNGSYYEKQITTELKDETTYPDGLAANVWRGAFVERMELAYAIADVVIARAGACTVSELELVGLPVIFVPSPNVAEDHQTKNALALVAKGAAEMVTDAEAQERVVPRALELLADEGRRSEMVANILKLGRTSAAQDVAEVVLKMAKDYGEK